MENEGSKSYAVPFLVVLFSMLWIAFAVVNYISSLGRIETTSTNRELEMVSDCNTAEIGAVFERYTQILSTVVVALEQHEEITSKESMDLLAAVASENIFARLAIDFTSGTSCTSDGHVVDIEQFHYLDQIKKGEPFVLDVLDAVVDGKPVVSVLVPIQGADGSYQSALRGSIVTDDLTDVFERTFAKSGGYYHVVDGNGRYVSTGKDENALLMGENYFVALDDLSYVKGFSAEQLMASFTAKERGHSQYSYQGAERYAYYAPVGINDWMLLMVIPKEIAEDIVNQHMVNAILLMVQIVVILLFFIFYAYFTQKHARDMARLNEKCFMVLTEQTNKAIFEWDYRDKGVRYLSNFKRLFGRDREAYQSVEEAMNTKTVHEDDLAALEALNRAVERSENVSNIRFRMLDDMGEYRWCEISLTFVKKRNGKPYKAMGFIENIDEQIRKEEQLRKKSETDQLTGIFNKATTEHLIQETLTHANPAHDHHALLIIDIDNYKDINDHLGHLYGDIVLAQLAATLRSLFCAGDILGRLGGDEFFVLLQQFGSEMSLRDKANLVCERLRKTYAEDEITVSISASVGISIYPQHGTSFEILYKAADTALYNVKSGGKNNFMIYDGVKMKHYIANRTDIDMINSIQKSFYSNKLEYLFKVLYDSDNAKVAVTLVLQLIAEQFGLSRADLFEIDDQRETVSCVFEWYAEGVPSIKALQQRRPISEYSFIIDELEKNGGIFMKPVEEIPSPMREVYEQAKVRSLICFSIMDGEKLVGGIDFHDYEQNVSMTPNDLYEMKTICQVLATFVLKQRSVEQERQYRQSIEMILNNIDGLAYVVDQDSWQIIFENEKIRQITKQSGVGQICYEVYAQRSAPCKKCPIRMFTPDCRKATSEINNTVYNIISKTSGYEIDWIHDQKAYLISSIDITEYKAEK